MEEENKKSENIKIITIGLCVVGLILIGFGSYKLFVVKPNENKEIIPSPTSTSTPAATIDNEVLSTDEAIEIAKDKLEAANNFFGKFESSFECKDSISEGYCYYDTLDNFKNKFYEIYSKQIEYRDVYIVEGTGDFSSNFNSAPQIMISENKVYVWNHCTEGTGGYSIKGNYNVDSVTNNQIVVKYVLNQNNMDLDENNDYDAEIKLVKEDNEWKLVKAEIIGRCTTAYTVGKES